MIIKTARANSAVAVVAAEVRTATHRELIHVRRA